MKSLAHFNENQALAGQVRIRPPTEKDAAIIHAMICHSPQLDSNSCYTYLLQAWHYAETCALAEISGMPAGYTAGFIPPRQPDTLFIWQVVVSPAFRGRGIARSMIMDLLARPSCNSIRHLESTVARGNDESEVFFRRIATHLSAGLSIAERLPAIFFWPDTHASERLFHIGPFHPRHIAGATGEYA